ncbi:MAG TPA: hypothetical protein DIW20_11070 [Rhodospirillaceae bacterium]|nr:hypothetical protein [Rhodospirillaceae bacterium]
MAGVLAEKGKRMILLGVIFIVIVAMAVVASARPWKASAKICTADNPMPAGGTDARWYHPDTDSVDENGPRSRRRCRHCGLEIDYAGD